MRRILLALALVLPAVLGCSVKDYKVSHGRVEIPLESGVLSLQVISPDIIHVSVVPPGADLPARKSLVVLPRPGKTDFGVSSSEKGVVVTTSALSAVVAPDGTVAFLDKGGSTLAGDGRFLFDPVEVEGKKAFSVLTRFSSDEGESFYGLGQHQAGELDHKGKSEELYQYNTKVSVPFVVSSKGYGILFDAYSLSRWGNPEPYAQLGEMFTLYDKDGVEGGLTGTYKTKDGKVLVRREDSLYFENEFAIKNLPQIPLNGAEVLYEGYIQAPETADYHFIQYYAGFQETFIGGETVMSRRWRPAWNPNSLKYSAHLTKGEKTPVRILWEPDGDVSYLGLRVSHLQTPQEENSLSFWSEFEPGVDFYFIAGGDYDGVIRGYRTLTGKAQVMPKWALGFWQSRERYSTQEELVETLSEFRRRHIPVDNIVQDWQY